MSGVNQPVIKQTSISLLIKLDEVVLKYHTGTKYATGIRSLTISKIFIYEVYQEEDIFRELLVCQGTFGLSWLVVERDA